MAEQDQYRARWLVGAFGLYAVIYKQKRKLKNAKRALNCRLRTSGFIFRLFYFILFFLGVQHSLVFSFLVIYANLMFIIFIIHNIF